MTLTRLAVPAALLLAALGLAWPYRGYLRAVLSPGRYSVEDRLRRFESPVRARLQAELDRAGIAWPPRRLILVGLKHEKQLEVWVDGGAGPRLLKRYPVLGASGNLGPKLREGDRQVPEGRYAIESLNPNSRFHLALRVNYPNAFDREHAQAEGRTDPGGDIMIHGGRASVGCLAMGDPAAEELFVLAAATGLDRVSVLLSPVDFRVRDLPADRPPVPPWTEGLYAHLRAALDPLR